MRKLFSLFAALTLSVGLWAQGSVFTYTATEKLETQFLNLGAVDTHDFNDGVGTVTYYSTITEITNDAFNSCSALQSITLPASILTIGGHAFSECTALQSITLPATLTTIGEHAFFYCTALQSITLPATLMTIGESAFEGCEALQSVTCKAIVPPTCGDDAFDNTSIPLYVPAGTKALYQNADQWKDFGNIVEPAPTPVSTTYIDENGVEQNIDAFEVKDASDAVTWGTADQTTWFVVNGTNVQLSKGAICAGDVRLILADGAKLTATGMIDITNWLFTSGIQVSGDGNSLTIYGQTAQSGKLIAQGAELAAGIGGGAEGNGSYITINGGEVEATGADGAGIGGGMMGEGSDITINGGEVTATGGNQGAGIGGGQNGSGSNITINGGTVEATGGEMAAGIGGGSWGGGSNITILAGIVTATGGEYAAGIGGGMEGSAVDIFVATSLVVKADGNNPPTTVIENTGTDLTEKLLGRQYVTIEPKPLPVSTTYIDENGETKNIDAFEVKDASEAVTWGTAGQTTWFVVNGTNVQLAKGAICAGDVRLILADNAKLTATGAGSAGIAVMGANSLTIYGQSTGDEMGQLIANGGDFAAGIGGGGYGGNGSNITINGGEVTATGGDMASGIGGGANAFGSNIFVATSLQVKADGNNPPTTVIAATRTATTDIANDLAGKRYATVETPAGPEVGEQFFDATSGLFFEVTAVGDNNTVKVIPSEYEKSSYIIPASVTYKNVALAVTEIDEVAFANRDALNSITIPASVITIGEYAFEYCEALASVTFAEGSQLQTIGAWAFNRCEALPNITIPASVTEIGEKTFLECTALTDIYVEAANTHYISEDGVLFDYAKDKLIQYPIGNTRTTYTIPTTVTTIELYSFYIATLTSVNIPASVTTIGESAFGECEALTSINIPASVTEIGELAFAFCSNLATITFAEGSQLTTVGYGAFSGCEVISSLDIPASVTNIGEMAFGYNPNLYDVTVHWTDAGNLPEMGELVFAGIAGPDDDTYLPTFATLHVPAGTKNMYKAAKQWQDFGIIEELAPAVEVYTRDVTEGNWGTICLPWESVALEGGDFYNVLGTKHAEKGVALTPIEAPDQLEAGKPYVFKATSEQIKVTYNPATEVAEEVYDDNHIIGSFEGYTVPNGMYIIYNNLLYITDGSSTIGANRAYFDADNMEPYNPATAPARVVFMGGRQTPTGLEVQDARCTMHDGKYLINGQFVIIKDNKMYNAQGIEL